MHFLLRARAVAVFPGGFGTFDEFFELLTLIQTGKMKPIPILLFGKEFWTRVIDFEALAEEGVITPADLELFRWCETAEEAWGAHRRVLRARLRDASSQRTAWCPSGPWPRAEARRGESAARTNSRAAATASLERQALAEQRRDRARQRAAGAVGVAGVDPRGRRS